MAQAWKMDAILVNEMTRWGRSTIDLMQTLQELHAWGVLLVATCKHSIQPKHVSRSVDANLMATFAEFEQDLVWERVRSKIAAALAREYK